VVAPVTLFRILRQTDCANTVTIRRLPPGWPALNSRCRPDDVPALLNPHTIPIMNNLDHQAAYPDTTAIRSALELGDEWNSEAIYELVRSHSGIDEMPAFLMLGQKEAKLLRGHLAKAFGEDAVITLKGTHYMGLEVVELRWESFVATAGRKMIRTLQDPMSRRPAWRDRETDALWQFRL
jgi:hypothetical protein